MKYVADHQMKVWNLARGLSQKFLSALFQKKFSFNTVKNWNHYVRGLTRVTHNLERGSKMG